MLINVQPRISPPPPSLQKIIVNSWYEVTVMFFLFGFVDGK